MKPSDVIKKCGWCKGTDINEKGQFCLEGAIYEACRSNKPKYERREYIYNLVESEIRKRCKNDWLSISGYNDAPHRRKADILNLLEKLGL